MYLTFRFFSKYTIVIVKCNIIEHTVTLYFKKYVCNTFIDVKCNIEEQTFVF